MRDWRSGAAKMHVLRAGLALRARKPALFAEGDYQKLEVSGPQAENIVAFSRVLGSEAVITIAPRLPLRLLGELSEPRIPMETWRNTELRFPESFSRHSWKNILDNTLKATPEEPDIAKLLRNFPCALIVGNLIGEENT
jgi:(1->4)-alpha-D-glucan 1-alpha-D-glucosylmutase